MAWTKDKIVKVNEKIIKRAATDAEFRAKALKNPKAVVEEVAGEALPNDFKIRFVDNKRATYTIVLPDPIKENTELSDSELERVAGGRCGGSCAGGTQAEASLGICF